MKSSLTNESVPVAAGMTLPTLWKAIEAMRSALIVSDAKRDDNPIVYCNQAFLDLTGYDRDEILGRNCRFLQGEDTDPVAVDELRDAVRSRQSVRVAIQNYRKDGKAFWNDLIVSPVFDDSGELINFVGLQLDITDRVTFEQKLRQSQRELEESNRELEQFNYAASHDLQEPLRMVSSYLQLIKERYGSKLDEDGETFINFAMDGSRRMQLSVNDLLTLSRLRTVPRKHKPEDLNLVVEDVLSNLTTAIADSDADITSDRLPKLKVDRTQMMQLFQNLLGNAIKYRHPGRRPVIRISVQRRRGMYRFTVKDNGIGIEPQYYQRIFGVFQRLHTRSEYSGTGVGLAICTKIVERHGGRISVESAAGVGSEFSFTLPA